MVLDQQSLGAWEELPSRPHRPLSCSLLNRAEPQLPRPHRKESAKEGESMLSSSSVSCKKHAGPEPLVQLPGSPSWALSAKACFRASTSR